MIIEEANKNNIKKSENVKKNQLNNDYKTLIVNDKNLNEIKDALTKFQKSEFSNFYNQFNNIESDFTIDKLIDEKEIREKYSFSNFKKEFEQDKLAKSLKNIYDMIIKFNLEKIINPKEIFESLLNDIQNFEKDHKQNDSDYHISINNRNKEEYVGDIHEESAENISREKFGVHQIKDSEIFIGEFENDLYKTGIFAKIVDNKYTIYKGDFKYNQIKKNYDFEGLYIPGNSFEDNDKLNLKFLIGHVGASEGDFAGIFCYENFKKLVIYDGKMTNNKKNSEKSLSLLFLKDIDKFNRASVFIGNYADNLPTGLTTCYQLGQHLFDVNYTEKKEEYKCKGKFFKLESNDKVSIFHGDMTIKNGAILPDKKGYLIFENNDVFKGELKNGVKHGKGEYLIINEEAIKDKEINIFKDKGKNSNKDISKDKNKSPIIIRTAGMYENDEIVKGSIFKNKNDLLYEGYFQKGEISQGKYFYGKVENYFGEFKNDKRNGLGKYVYSDSSSYEGEWKDNLKHGKGSFTTAEGNMINSTWINNKMESIN